jgi:hypothetical protein
MSASITEVDKFGLVTVTFRQKMKVQEASSISNKVLSISVIPHLGAMYPDKLGFNWECVDFTEENMQIKLTFENPLYVSYKESDMLMITIKDSSFFRREAFEDYLPVKYSMSRKIMSIMEENIATAILSGVTDSAKSAMDVSLVFNLLTNIAFSSSMYLLWGLINTLQMILYLPMIGVNFPANVKFLYSILIPVACMDLIPREYTTDLIFDISEDEDSPYNDILEELGYETHSSILNLGSIFTYFLLFVSGSLLMLVLKLTGMRSRKIRHAYKYLKDILMFNAFILLFMEGCMEVVISAFVNLYSNVFYTRSDVISYYFSYLALVITVILLPAGLIFVINVRKKALQCNYWKKRFGSVYEGIRIDSKWALSYNLFQVLRRLLFLFVVFHPGFEMPSSLRIMAVIYISLFMNMYQFSVRPFEVQSKNNLENFNETIIFTVTFSVILFTDYLDVDQQNMAGWATISFVALNILVNLVTMLYPPILKLYLKCKRKLAPKKKFNKVELVAHLANQIEMV